MTAAAWTFMIVVWTLIISQTGYCFYKLLSSPKQLDSGGDTDDS
ncbi:MAG: hypothetical protein AB7K24_19845 [Gemmataceae bacterium]